ncbi:hypothetical protein OS493_007148 [Desmophyllum pertusum]|uniref:CCHC-type domain-containing protein n=1 Tax=Desmophyllum pertusum TaxID=174260 RepID=A0A9W9ZG75_9CNID|nr:hypothetical protein OS493_007148 [Desmophyllum pertusum]
MSVKRAVTVCSHDVALDILKGPLPPEDTVGSRTYLKQCYKLFQIFNNNSEVDPACYTQTDINNDMDAGNDLTKAQPSDTCFRCHKLGHWASECPEGHEPEWLAKQKCFLCGQQGHIQSACPKKSEKRQRKSKIMENKPPPVKRTWYSDSTSLPKQLSTLTAKKS